MRECVKVLAPAKINLGLQVYPRRRDGFHDILSIFTTVRLFDELEVSLLKDENTCVVECDGMTLPSENTFTKAYKAFCVLTGNKSGIKVHVTKHIPSGGGLGGGSSDASSFIQSIDSLLNTRLNASALHAIAGETGSDVFFFTHALLESDPGDVYAAVVSGRGENVRKIDSRNDFHTVLLFPGVSVSTKEAYELVDETLSEKDQAASDLEKVYSGPVSQWSFSNDFTVPVCSRFPVIGEALKDLEDSGAEFTDMSGSGSTVFGVFSSRQAAENAVKKLGQTWNVVLA